MKFADPEDLITSFEETARNEVEIYHRDLAEAAGGKILCKGKKEWSWLTKASHNTDNFR